MGPERRLPLRPSFRKFFSSLAGMITNTQNTRGTETPPATVRRERQTLNEPSVVQQASEIYKWLDTLKEELLTLHRGLFEPVPPSREGDVPSSMSLQDLIGHCATEAAEAVGFVRTVNARLGFEGYAGK